jgi:uncharacterized membrane protein
MADALETLNQRLASGEIDVDEYNRVRSALQDSPPAAPSTATAASDRPSTAKEHTGNFVYIKKGVVIDASNVAHADVVVRNKAIVAVSGWVWIFTLGYGVYHYFGGRLSLLEAAAVSMVTTIGMFFVIRGSERLRVQFKDQPARTFRVSNAKDAADQLNAHAAAKS